MRMTNRVAVVSGAAGGIGAAVAVRLAMEGASVALVDLHPERCEPIVAEISRLGGASAAFGCDISVSAQVQAVSERIRQEFTRVDILVNNAGILRDAPLIDMVDAEWQDVINVNLTSMFFVCRAFAPGMIERRYGKIVNMSSRSALGNAGQTNYSAAKAGVQGFTATLAIELGPHNINVNAVAPGYFTTPMTASIAAQAGVTHSEHQADVASRTPLRRVGRPEELAAVIAFLASDDAAYVSGQTIYVNGGAR